MTPNLDALAERLEAAPCGTRELSGLIHEALGNCIHREQKYYCIEDGNDTDSGFTCVACGEDMHGKARQIPAYTTSLDAALTLVPEGTINGDQRLWVVDIQGLLGEWPIVGVCRVDVADPIRPVQARTAPLAICIASLRARAAQQEQRA